MRTRETAPALPKRRALTREIALALVVKCAVLYLIWLAWFSDSADRHVGPESISARIVSSQQIKEHIHAP